MQQKEMGDQQFRRPPKISIHSFKINVDKKSG